MNILPPRSLEPGNHLVGVRPEHLNIGPDGPLTMMVQLVEKLGHETLITGVVGDKRVVVRQDSEESLPGVGDRVQLDAPQATRHRFDAVTERRIDA